MRKLVLPTGIEPATSFEYQSSELWMSSNCITVANAGYLTPANCGRSFVSLRAPVGFMFQQTRACSSLLSRHPPVGFMFQQTSSPNRPARQFTFCQRVVYHLSIWVWTKSFKLVEPRGIEPRSKACKAPVLPLYYDPKSHVYLCLRWSRGLRWVTFLKIGGYERIRTDKGWRVLSTLLVPASLIHIAITLINRVVF